MDFLESPPKRQKTLDSSPDVMSKEDYDLPHETIATVPIDNAYDSGDSLFDNPIPTPPRAAVASGNLDVTRQTQPTQIIDRGPVITTSSPTRPDVVQVAASSPAPTPIPARRPGGLASAMAPAGTSYRVPKGVTRGPMRAGPIYISDNDEPSYRGGSSDSDTTHLKRNDIKTSNFGKRVQDTRDKVEESPQAKTGSNKFQDITASAVYRPAAKGTNLSGSLFDSRNRSNGTTTSSIVTGSAATKRSADTMANAYGGVSRDPKKPRQDGPARALPVIQESTEDLSLDDIPDYQLRQKVAKINAILPNQTVRSCFEALIAKMGSKDDAMDLLVAQEDLRNEIPNGRHIDLTGSDDELMPTPVTARQQPQNKAPVQYRSVREKWATSQVSKAIAPKPTAVVVPVKKGGRLVRGRKRASSPGIEEISPPTRTTKQLESSDSDEADSGLQSEVEDISFDGRVLAFFNNCSPADLADTSGKNLEVATYLLSRRPFKSLHAVRQVQAAETKSSKSKRKPAPIGEAIVEKCEEMIGSYEAVDFLVKKCEAIGKPIAQEMKQWGINAYGSKDGELDMVSLRDSQSSNHDSGIGTPTSELEGKIDSSKTTMISQPAIMSDQIQLKDYQIVGINWLALLYKQKVSAILADDMGLGKTCQVIGFLAHLMQTGQNGPHLVVVPASTLENWLTEFRKFCPALVVEPYYASQNERAELRDKLDMCRDDVNVVITTYQTAKGRDDFPWLRRFGFCYTIFDEGHALKNADSQVYQKLVRIKTRYRLLLTGTPLQNNLQELISLLGFLMPDIFDTKKADLQAIFVHKVKALDSNHEALLSAQRIARARSMLTPFILRRKKHQVLKHLPTKTRRVETCEMTEEQMGIYQEDQERARSIIARRAAGEPMGNESANVLMRLREAAIHPLMFRRNYTEDQLRAISKACIKEDQWAESNPALIYTELVAYSDMEVHQLCAPKPLLRKFCLKPDKFMASGKAQRLCELLVQFKRDGHRTLIFSQLKMVLDILEIILNNIDMDYLRLDGSTPVALRQEMINEYNAEESKIPVFMLSTKAGGAGINLATANKVIIFDSGFNPQDDIQAENRAHRIGQQRDVEVIRFVSTGTVEEAIYAMGLTKLALDSRVAGDEEDQKTEEKKEELEAEGQKLVEEMLFKKLETETETKDPKPALVNGNSAEVRTDNVTLSKKPKGKAGKKVKSEIA